MIGITVKKSEYGNGWMLGHVDTQWTLWTVYLDQNGGFTLYQAIPDIWKGINCEDERLILQTKEPWLLQCRLHGEFQKYIYGPAQTRIRDTWEGKLLQAFS